MSRTPESGFVSKLEKLLDSQIHCEGMANPYRGGTPDRYYEAYKKALWVEYKYCKDVPATWNAGHKITALQKKWLKRAYYNNIDVLVIAGFGEHIIMLELPTSWDIIYTREMIYTRAQPITEIATYLNEKLLCKVL